MLTRPGPLPSRVPQGGQNPFLGMSTPSCRRRVLLLGEEDHVAGRFLKLSLVYFSGFGSLDKIFLSVTYGD